MAQKTLLNKQVQHNVDNHGTGQDGVRKKHLARIIRHHQPTDRRKSGIAP
jgi:hypothetical protein